jgi:hypothetical protein
MMTGTIDVAVVVAVSPGADGVPSKPNDVAILVATVTKCVERRTHQV